MSTTEPSVVSAKNVNVFYGPKQALKGVQFDAPANKVTTLIGPSGCGKSTFLRSLNRMNDRIANFRLEGEIRIEGSDPYAKGVDLMNLRRSVGMVFQKPNPFPMSIYENVALGPRLHYGAKGKELDDIVESSLREAALWDEVKDD
ncbi:MAG: phosphate ABC transporter ATP-binding protein, partial [Fimbriimonas sp.]